MCISETAEPTEIRKIIDGCEVILKFREQPNDKLEDTIVDILMSSLEQRLYDNLD